MDEAMDQRVRRIEANRVVRGLVSGGLLRVVERVELPAAGEAHAGEMAWVRGVEGVSADVAYMCLRDSSGVWDWRVVATG